MIGRAKKERENTKKSRGAEKQVFEGGPLYCMQPASAAQCCNLRGGQRESNCDIALWLGIATSVQFSPAIRKHSGE